MQTYCWVGRGGGLVVSALAYCSKDLSSNPADYLIFLFIVRNDKNKKEKEAWVGPFKKLTKQTKTNLKDLDLQ